MLPVHLHTCIQALASPSIGAHASLCQRACRLLRERDAARTLAENAQRALEAAPTSQLLANGKRPADEDVEMADAGNKRVRLVCSPVAMWAYADDLSTDILDSQGGPVRDRLKEPLRLNGPSQMVRS